MRARWGNTTYTFICLGVGAGIKERWLLRKLLTLNEKARICVLLVDINSQMLQWAASGFREFCDRDNFQLTYVHADFDRLPVIDKLLPDTDGPVVFLLLGGLFGNQEETLFLQSCKRLANAHSYLLMGVQTVEALHESSHVEGYDTSANFRFVARTVSQFDKKFKLNKHNPAAAVAPDALSDVPDTETIVVTANSPAFGATQLAYSRRYNRDKLSDFLERTQILLVLMMMFRPQGFVGRYGFGR